MRVKFIAHAGFYVEESDGSSLMVDPWFYSSTPDAPVIPSVMPGLKTVDFQSPRSRDRIESFKPQAILTSHFHTHHSPLPEIKTFIEQCHAEKLILGTAPMTDSAREKLIGGLGEAARKTRIEAIEADGQTFRVGSLTVTGFEMTYPDHRAWLVQSPTGSFMHFADLRLSKNGMDKRVDPTWMRFQGLAPDFAVYTVGGHLVRKGLEGGRRWIDEVTTLSPAEAARIVQIMQPKRAAVMGIYNHSIYTGTLEIAMPYAVVEEQFRWCVEHLAPETRCLVLRPGDDVELSGSWSVKSFDSRPVEGPAGLFD